MGSKWVVKPRLGHVSRDRSPVQTNVQSASSAGHPKRGRHHANAGITLPNASRLLACAHVWPVMTGWWMGWLARSPIGRGRMHMQVGSVCVCGWMRAHVVTTWLLLELGHLPLLLPVAQ